MVNRHQIHQFPNMLLLSVLVFLLGGCGAKRATVFEYHRVDSQAKAGSAQISVQMIAPWDHYVDAMSANFSMDEQTALSSVLPTSLLLTRKELDAAQFAAKLAPPISSSNRTQTQTIDAQGLQTTSEENSRTRGPGDPAQVSFADSIAGGRTAGNLDAISLAEQSIAVDPFLQHQVALALKQEVALLNRQVQDAALRDGLVPYIVRVQVSLLPNARHQPYDVNVDTSFFYGNDLEDSPGKPFKTPVVMPMLVTDNLEAALQSRSINQLRQQMVALNLMLKGFGANVDAQNFNEQFESAFGRDLNSLMTVSRASDNTLRVRLGAQLTPSSQYTMVTRTHNVSFVLLVDKRYEKKMEIDTLPPTMTLVSRTDMIDAINGEKLRDRSTSEIGHELATIANNYGLNKHPRNLLNELIGIVQKNKYTEFHSTVKNLTTFPEALWSSLVEVIDGSSFKSASFELRRERPIDLDSNQSLLLVDDGKKTSVMLRGTGFVAKKLFATLNYKGFRLSNSLTKVEDEHLAITFPSLAKWGLINVEDGKVITCDGDINIELALQEDPWNTAASIGENGGNTSWSFNTAKTYTQSPGTKCRYFKVKEEVALKDPTASGSFSINSATGVVVSKEGAGSLKISVQINKEKDKKKTPKTEHVTLSISGADIDDAKGQGAALQPGNKVKVTESTDVFLKLSRLTTGFKVTVNAEDKSEKKAPPIELLIL